MNNKLIKSYIGIFAGIIIGFGIAKLFQNNLHLSTLIGILCGYFFVGIFYVIYSVFIKKK